MRLPASPPAILALVASCALASAQSPVSPRIDPVPLPIPKPSKAEQTKTVATKKVSKPKGPPPSEQHISELAAQFKSNRFRVRESAQIQLTRLAKDYPEITLDSILEKYFDTDVPEERHRLRGILYSTKRAKYMAVPRGFVGIVMNSSFARGGNNEIIQSIQIMRVVPGSAAEKFGLRLMDHILEVDGKPIASVDALGNFADYITGKTSGDDVELKIQRNRQEKTIKLELGQRPPGLPGQTDRVQERFDSEFRSWLSESRTRLKSKKK